MTEKTGYGTIARLGVYMRAVGSKLTAATPMTSEAANAFLKLQGCFYGEFGGHQTLERLEARGIALRTDQGWVRGEHWPSAARYYRWEETNMNKHTEAVDKMLSDLESAASLLEGEFRSGTKFQSDQMRRLKVVRRQLVYIEEESQRS